MWEETLVFMVHMPEIALVRFLVWDHDPIGRDFIGQRTLAFSSMMPGGQGTSRVGKAEPWAHVPHRPAYPAQTSVPCRPAEGSRAGGAQLPPVHWLLPWVGLGTHWEPRGRAQNHRHFVDRVGEGSSR